MMISFTHYRNSIIYSVYHYIDTEYGNPVKKKEKRKVYDMKLQKQADSRSKDMSMITFTLPKIPMNYIYINGGIVNYILTVLLPFFWLRNNPIKRKAITTGCKQSPNL